jgi:hypothetical protein
MPDKKALGYAQLYGTTGFQRECIFDILFPRTEVMSTASMNHD